MELGITAVEILPVLEYDELEFQRSPNTRDHMVNVWGYSHLNFFAPMARFAAGGGGTLAAATEFKQLVKALHAAGIEVILDVVYNHTNEGARSAAGMLTTGNGRAQTWPLLLLAGTDHGVREMQQLRTEVSSCTERCCTASTVQFRPFTRLHKHASDASDGYTCPIGLVVCSRPGGDDDPYTTSFRGIDNPTYYMTDTSQYVQLLNFSGCGNTTNANNPIMKKLIIDSLRMCAAQADDQSGPDRSVQSQSDPRQAKVVLCAGQDSPVHICSPTPGPSSTRHLQMSGPSVAVLRLRTNAARLLHS